MANKKTSQETLETNLTADDLFRYSKKTGSIFNSRAINKENLAYQILGYRRFVGVLSQTGIQDPTIEQVIVNDVNLTNADFNYDATGVYVIDRPDLMTGLWNQAGVGVVGNNDYRTYWVMYPYDSNQIYFNTYSLDDMALRDDILGFLVELRFPL